MTASSMSGPSLRRVSVRIDLNALCSNLVRVRDYQPAARVFSVLKADAYGHGAISCAEALSQAGTDAFATVFPAEAEQLRNAGIDKPVLVLQGPHTPNDVKLLAEKKLWAVIHDHTQLALLESVPAGKQITVWVKVDTGMGRMGIGPEALPGLLDILARMPQVQCDGVLTHMANADTPEDAHNVAQIAQFNALPVPKTLSRSLANSAAVMAWSQTGYDWIRPGIMLYGASPLPDAVNHALAPVMHVSAPLVAIKQHRRGDGIGYAQTFHCPEDMPIGYAAIGYGDGLPRVLNNAQVLLNTRKVAIVGRVSMDSIALDLRGCDAAVADKVTLWGPGCPVEHMAAAAGTVSYELLCAIKGRRDFSNRAN